MRHSKLLSKYTLFAILPYFIMVWLLLSVVLFVQQGSRYSELIFDALLPDALIWQLTFALIPSVIAFTSPVALLVGVVIGLSRMQGDSEMTAIRAAGVGNAQIVLPVLILGLLLSFFALFINLKGVPFAAQIVRQVALKAALFKLESPVDPGVFNTEIENLTIFVREGDIGSGKWKKIFILQDSRPGVPGSARLITAEQGFVATEGDRSEIVLENAQIISSDSSSRAKSSMEKVERIRISVDTKRGEIIERLRKSKETAEEMGLSELAAFAYTLEGTPRTEAFLLWQRRIILSITPLIFSLLGAALVSKFNRGGRGFGIFLALVSLIVYYFLTLAGEQLARTGAISVGTGGLLPLVVIGILIVWLFYSRKVNVHDIAVLRKLKEFGGSVKAAGGFFGRAGNLVPGRSILDTDIVITVLRNYLLTLGFLTVMYVVFTAFELWKFAGTIDNGVSLLAQYLFYLIPFVYLEIAPSALMVAAIATYVIKTRQNEVVTWTSAGRSVYRILMPCFVLAMIIGGFNLEVQELVVTESNRVQDSLRARIRSRNKLVETRSGLWLAGRETIVSFERSNASDNGNKVENIAVYRFGKDPFEIRSVVRATKAVWKGDHVEFETDPTEQSWSDSGVVTRSIGSRTIQIGSDPFKGLIVKPSHLNIAETKYKLNSVLSPSEYRSYAVALHKKYTAPFLPFIIVLITAPFALSIHSSGNVVTIVYAAGLWLVFIGTKAVFEQFGQSGLLSPVLAVWSPLVLMGLVGLLMLSRVRT